MRITTKSMMSLIKGVLVIPLCVALILAPYSLLFGWNLITVILFWFVIIPVVAVYLPALVSGNGNQLKKSLLGIMLLYVFMVFMIYKHYQSDFFKVMMVGSVVNLIVVIGLSKITRSPVTSSGISSPQ